MEINIPEISFVITSGWLFIICVLVYTIIGTIISILFLRSRRNEYLIKYGNTSPCTLKQIDPAGEYYFITLFWPLYLIIYSHTLIICFFVFH